MLPLAKNKTSSPSSASPPSPPVGRLGHRLLLCLRKGFSQALPLASPPGPPFQCPFTSKQYPFRSPASPPPSCPSQKHMENSRRQWLERLGRWGCVSTAYTCFQFPYIPVESVGGGSRPERKGALPGTDHPASLLQEPAIPHTSPFPSEFRLKDPVTLGALPT